MSLAIKLPLVALVTAGGAGCLWVLQRKALAALSSGRVIDESVSERLAHAVAATGMLVYEIPYCEYVPGREGHQHSRPIYFAGLENLLGEEAVEAIQHAKVSDQRWWIAQIHPDDREEYLASQWHAVNHLRADEYSLTYRVRDGRGRHHIVRDSAQVIRDTSTGEPRRIIGGIIDVTDEFTARAAEGSARAAMNEAVRRFEALAGTAPGIVWTTDPAGNADFMSEAWTRVTGQSVADALGLGYREMLHPEDAASAQAKWEQAAAASATYEGTIRYRSLKGGTVPGESASYRWHLVRARPLLDAGKKIRGWVGMAVDIEELHRAQERLAENTVKLLDAERRFELATWAMSGWVFEWDFTTGGLWVSNGVHDLLGIEPDSIRRAEDWLERVHPDDRPGSLADVMEHFRTTDRSHFEREYRVRHTDGRWLYVSERSVVFRDEAGKLLKMVGGTIDVSSRVETREALTRSERRNKSLVVAIASAVWITDASGAVLPESVSLAEHTGLPVRQIVGWNWTDAVYPDDRERVIAAWNRSLASGELYDIEYRLRDASGEYRWTQNRAVAVRDSGGKIVEWVGISMDAHERRMAQDRLMEAKTVAEAARSAAESARAAAENASRAKDRFLAVLSHELRTPLNPVVLTVSAMTEREEIPPDVRDQLQMVRRNLELESRLIDDLLDLSRVASGKLRMRPKVTSVHEGVRDALDAVAPDASAKGITIREDLTANRDVVCVDDGRLQQVLWNLLKNAVKFTAPGGEVRITSRRDRREIVVEVTDTGIGIAPDAQARIFDAFVQADSSIAREFGGLGLGLAISRAVVEMMKGSLKVTSPGLGQGSTFTVRLPLAVARLPRAWRRSEIVSTSGQNTTEARAQKLKLLLVEDHPDTARVVARLLQMSGHDVTVAHNVSDALRVSEGVWWDLIISDLGLPDATGYDLMRTLRKRHARRGLPVPLGIAVSGYGMEEDVRKSRDAGFCEHLTKPLAFNTLNDAIRRVTTVR
jgi:PAS domain S-box-containing protein